VEAGCGRENPLNVKRSDFVEGLASPAPASGNIFRGSIHNRHQVSVHRAALQGFSVHRKPIKNVFFRAQARKLNNSLSERAPSPTSERAMSAALRGRVIVIGQDHNVLTCEHGAVIPAAIARRRRVAACCMRPKSPKAGHSNFHPRDETPSSGKVAAHRGKAPVRHPPSRPRPPRQFAPSQRSKEKRLAVWGPGFPSRSAICDNVSSRPDCL